MRREGGGREGRQRGQRGVMRIRTTREEGRRERAEGPPPSVLPLATYLWTCPSRLNDLCV